MQLKEILFDFCVGVGVAIHDNVEWLAGAISFPLLMKVDISDELGHLAFTICGSAFSGALAWLIKKYLDANSEAIFRSINNFINKYLKKNGNKKN